jgi:murein DD-endopeptidase MepM/ murein hydrolase activator NlpD
MAQSNKKIIKKLRHNYRLVLREDSSLEEKSSLRLNLLNLLMFLSIAMLLFGILFFLLFKYTPLGDVIRPSIFRGNSKELLLNTDKYLSEMAQRNNVSLAREKQLRAILSDEITEENIKLLKDEFAKPIDMDNILSEIRSSKSSEESKKKQELKSPTGKKKNNALFSPVKGKISRGFDLKSHPAVDVIPDKYDAVNSVKDGIVVFSSWTPEFGHVIALQHSNNLISIYKHNSVLFKKVGTFVEAGESIAVVGNSGELTSGKHLHFELWEDGRAVDPENYVSF